MDHISPANASTIESYNELSDEALAAWDPEGDAGRRLLLNPTIFRLLGDVADQRILDAGCGQGYLSRLLADRGAAVVGVEPAGRLVAYCERLEARRRQGIRFVQRDLSRLGDVDGPFDAVVANMVLVDIADWRAAMRNCVSALRQGGLLVYSLHHPCWVPGATATWATNGTVALKEYLNEYSVMGDIGSSVNFHRPLSTYVNETIELGCRIVEVVEPRLAPDAVKDPTQEVLVHIPNYIVIAAERDAAEWRER